MHSTEELLQGVRDYASRHPHTIIKIGAISAETGIGKATYYRRKEVIDEIEKLNRITIHGPMPSNFEFPSAADIVENCENHEQLVKSVQGLLDAINSLKEKNIELTEHQKALETGNKKDLEQLRAKNMQLECKLKDVKTENAVLQSQLDGQHAESALLMQHDVVESMKKSNFKSQFDALFEGEDD